MFDTCYTSFLSPGQQSNLQKKLDIEQNIRAVQELNPSIRMIGNKFLSIIDYNIEQIVRYCYNHS